MIQLLKCKRRRGGNVNFNHIMPYFKNGTRTERAISQKVDYLHKYNYVALGDWDWSQEIEDKEQDLTKARCYR